MVLAYPYTIYGRYPAGILMVLWLLLTSVNLPTFFHPITSLLLKINRRIVPPYGILYGIHRYRCAKYVPCTVCMHFTIYLCTYVQYTNMHSLIVCIAEYGVVNVAIWNLIIYTNVNGTTKRSDK